MIAICYGVDSSIYEQKLNGILGRMQREVNNLSSIGKVYLFTYDTKNLSFLFKNTVHVPCGFGKHLYIRKILYPLIGLIQMLRYIKYFKIIRVFGVGCPQAALISVLTRKSLISSYHYEFAKQAKIIFAKKGPFGFIFSFFAEMIEYLVLKYSKVIIALTAHLAYVAKRKGAKRIIIIPNGVDLNFLKRYSHIPKKRLRNTLGIENNKKVLIYVGRLVPIKRVDFIIHAFAKVHKQFQDCVLYILGDGPERKKLENLSKSLGVNSSVHFMGYVSNEVVIKFLLCSDLFINASLIEGHPKAVIEAMACKCPIIASNVTGNNDVLQNNKTALLFTHDVDELTEKIMDLLNHPNKSRKLSKNAYNEVLKKYDLKVVEEKNRCLIKEFL